MRFSAGTLTSWKLIQPVEPARTPNLPWISPRVTPGECRSTMKEESASEGLEVVGFVLTVTSARSALEAREIHIFSPFRVYESPSRLAEVRIAATSDPMPGSVKTP